jgi:hypothetical protein
MSVEACFNGSMKPSDICRFVEFYRWNFRWSHVFVLQTLYFRISRPAPNLILLSSFHSGCRINLWPSG